MLSVLKPDAGAGNGLTPPRGASRPFSTPPRRAASSMTTKPIRRDGRAISTSFCRNGPSSPAAPHAAMPYAEVPAFVASLRERPATAARALEFGILTAARSGEVFGGALGRNRHRRQSLDDPRRAHKGGPRASRSIVGSRARDRTGNEGRSNQRLCLSRPATSSPVVGHGVRNALAAHRTRPTQRAASEARSAIGPATKRISRVS